MVDLEINKEIVFSTAHITSDIAFDLENDVHYGLIVIKDNYYYRILTEFKREDVENEKPPEVLKNLLDIAVRNKCKWLVLDLDGPRFEQLESFNW